MKKSSTSENINSIKNPLYKFDTQVFYVRTKFNDITNFEFRISVVVQALELGLKCISYTIPDHNKKMNVIQIVVNGNPFMIEYFYDQIKNNHFIKQNKKSSYDISERTKYIGHNIDWINNQLSFLSQEMYLLFRKINEKIDYMEVRLDKYDNKQRTSDKNKHNRSRKSRNEKHTKDDSE